MRFLSISATGIFIAIAVLSADSNPAWGQTEKVFGEVTADQALVYFICPNRSGHKRQLYLDGHLLLQTKGNRYGFAHIDPGQHWLWGGGCPVLVEFVPGETYYVLVLVGLSVLGSDEGQQYLEAVERYEPPPTPQTIAMDMESGLARDMRTNFLKAVGRQERVEIAEVPPPPMPARNESLVRVPQHTFLELELSQSITTSKTSTGDEIWFRVAADAEIDGQVWLSAGTPVRGTIVFAHTASSGGVGGHFELVVPGVTAHDGTTVPVSSRLISAGRPRIMNPWSLGLLGLAVMSKKGREAYELAGSRWPAWTRHEVWVQPPMEPATTPALTASSIQPCQANAVSVKEFLIAPESRKWPVNTNAANWVNPPWIKILIEGQDEIQSLEITSVGGRELHSPLEALRLMTHEEGQVGVFDGWDLLRHLLPEENLEVRLKGTLSDGISVDCNDSFRLSMEVASAK